MYSDRRWSTVHSDPAAQTNQSTDWFADETFWTDYAPILFGGERWAEVPVVVDSILALSSAVPGSRVLDVCCGPGRHALEFAKRGYQVTGVDITKPYVEAARESMLAMNLSAEFIHADAREWSRNAAFDLAINLFTSFGYFETRAEDVLMLRHIHQSLKPGGTLAMELLGKEMAARDFIEGEWFERDGRFILTEFSVVGAWEGLRNRWVIMDGKQRVDRVWVQRLYSATELRSALVEAGFASVDLFGSWSGTPYDASAGRLVALARA